ncbi:MAG: hypothetical protein IKQ69_06930 [Oscillospiraceae bacterium]|nr:hypothetical protein [Oscillospiraceae bacterium]
MTLGEGKAKVYMLLDEHSAGGEVEHDEDIEAKMAFFFDMAQKEVAKIQRILRTKRITVTADKREYRLPEDFQGLYRIWKNDKPATGRFRFRGGRLLTDRADAGSELLLEYFAIPGTITADTPDDYVFELREDGCSALPYYVAAQQLLPDLVMDYTGMLGMYQLALSTLSTGLPEESGRTIQRLYRG